MAESNPAPGFARDPGRRMDYAPAGARVRVVFAGETVADTGNAVALREADYPVVYYVPRADARMDLMERSARATHCPFKGDASYWTLAAAGRRAEDAVWSYEAPFDEARAIDGLLAFYPDKVDRIEVG